MRCENKTHSELRNKQTNTHMELKSYDGKNFLNTWNVNEERNITRVSKETLQAVRTEDEEISPASVKFSGSSKK